MSFITFICLWKSSEKEKEKENKELKNLRRNLNHQAQSFGYKSYNPTIFIDSLFAIDEKKKLFNCGHKLLRIQNIKSCRIELETKIQNNAMKIGLADGILAGITGVEIIRDVDTLKEEVYTGRAFLFITFINYSGKLETKKFYFNDINKAEKIEEAINKLIF